MKNLKALAATLLLAATAAVAAPSAQARNCFTASTGGTICNTYQGSNRYGDIYTLGYGIVGNGEYVSESMTVVCDGARVADWESHGNMSQLGAQRLANYFCSL